MPKLTDEMKEKLLAARSAEEAAELLKDHGVDAPLAERIWNEISADRENRHLDLDELEAVAGGKRNWAMEGCAATVEEGSDCWGTDACDWVSVSYEYFDASAKCPNYPGPHQMELTNRLKKIYTCKHCGWSYQDLPADCYAVFA